MQKLEEITTAFGLCDGPSWDGAGSLYVPDVKGQKLYRYWPRGNKMQVLLPDAGRISATFFNHGRLYLSDNGNSSIAWLHDRNKIALQVNDQSARPPQRPNDLVVDHHGGIYYTLTATDQVMYISPEGEQSVAVEEIQTPNGIILSPDEQTLYVASYVPKEIYAYRVATPGVVDRGKKFATMDDGDAKGADGMCVDRAGNIYCAGATDIWIWSPSGKLLDKITPPSRPINCTFGDYDMQSLYITCFSGLYKQRMKISGDSPQPPSDDQTTVTPNETHPSTLLPENIIPHYDVVYAERGNRKLLADLLMPKPTGDARPAIVVVHGGGWLKGDKTKFRGLALALAKRGYVTMAIEYRLGGEARFPAAIHDCHEAVRYLRQNANNYFIDQNRIGAVGGSAGGHLVGLMATGHDIPELQGQGGLSEVSSKLQAAIVMAGPMEIITGAVAERSRKHPEAANATHWIGPIAENEQQYRLADAHQKISADDPPILFMVGEHDKPERNQPSRDQLKNFGVWTDVIIYKDGKHGCWNRQPWFDEMVDDMDRYFRKHLE